MRRHKYSLSYYKLLSMRLGEIIPIGLLEVLPGDTIQQATSALMRTSPLLAPVMHPVSVKIHHWFVPNRLVWEDWEDFITGGADGDDASVFPTINLASDKTNIGDLSDYLGVQPVSAAAVVNALPFRGYALIYNEWYRDADLMAELPISIASGTDSTTNVDLVNAAWEKDYFTSARPWAQKGTAVSVPLTTGSTAVYGGVGVQSSWEVRVAATGNLATGSTLSSTAGGGLVLTTGATPVYLDPGDPSTAGSNLQFAATTGNLGFTPASLREALAIQRYQEARARYGSRYTEYLRYLGVRSSDARLQRPEYLGGGKQTIQFSEVLQTAEGDAPVGELRGHGISAMRSNRYRRFFEEHGYVFSFVIVRPKPIYTQGLPRTFNRRTKEDYWQRELEHIGQQEILNKEVYQAHASPDGTFGWQDRYDEYRRQESTVAGEFRDQLDFWHFARVFTSDPALNSTFVTSVPTERVFAATTNDTLYVMANHSIQARRLVTPNATPRTF